MDMNDTNLSERQRQILSMLKEKGNASRVELANGIVTKKGASRITIIRDINSLVNEGLVKVKGKGKSTSYSLGEVSLILQYLDIKKYFETDSDQRQINTDFNKSVYPQLKNLYYQDETKLWEKSKIFLKEAKEKLDPSIYKRELERFIIELSWKSSQIEGNTYSLIETETLIKENIKAYGHPEEEAVMILNHKDAFETILEKTDSFKKLDYLDIIQLHQVLTKGLVTSGLRSQTVRITGTKYKPLSDKYEIKEELESLIKLVNMTQYPPEKALIVALMIAYLQPFADGNKRTSRMLANAILLAYGYFPLSYRNVDVNEYRSSMIVFYEINNLYCFKRLFIKQLQFALENYFQN